MQALEIPDIHSIEFRAMFHQGNPICFQIYHYNLTNLIFTAKIFLFCHKTAFINIIIVLYYIIIILLNLSISIMISLLICNILAYFSGSLVMQHPGEMTTPTQGSVLIGTVNGAIC